MEREEIQCEIQEQQQQEEEEEEEIEGLQTRRGTKSSDIIEEAAAAADDDDLKNVVDINGGIDNHLVSLKSSDNGGGIDVSGAELKQQPVDFNNSDKFVFYQDGQGTGFSNGLSSNGHSGIQHTAPEKINGDSKIDVTITSLNIGQCLSQERELEHEKQHGSLSGSSLLPSEISPEEDKASLNFSSYKEIQSSDTNLLYASDHHEATELDVERVLRKQDTHDLYCPNCNSCITKRVIIRKRKRRLPNLGEDGKRNKLENGTGPGSISTSVPTTSNPSHNTVDTCVDGGDAPASNNIDQDQEPDVFRCLSCFSIFIPTGVSASADVETDDTDVLTPSNSTRQQNGSVSSIHESSSHAQTNLNGDPSKTNINESVEGGTNKLSPQKVSLAEPGSLNNFKDQVSMNLNKENWEASLNESPPNAIHADGESVWSEISGSKEGGINVLSPQYYEVLLNHEGEHPRINLAGIPPTTSKEGAEISTFKPQENGLKFFIPTDVSSFTVETSKADQKANGTIPDKSSDEKEMAFLPQTPLSYLEESYTDSKVNITSSISPQNEQNSGASLISKFATQPENREVATNDEEKIHHSEGYQHNNRYKEEAYTDEPLTADQSAPIPVIQNTLLLHGRQINLRNTLKDTAAQKSSAEIGNLQHLETRIQINVQRGTSTEGIQGLEIIKSIVYGGLVESISSLGVVSSAAGSDATTLNVLALGLATLIGGLIIIGHNLWELKNDKKTEASDQLDERVDRYHELLGHRKNFMLHAVFAILSFLIFGLIPPVTYGFSLRKSDDKNLKLVIVAAASLLAIIILASGKAYVKRTPKSYIKTVLYYVIMGMMVSGISYEVGNLMNMFLEKLNVFQSSLVVTLPEIGLMKPAWASY